MSLVLVFVVGSVQVSTWAGCAPETCRKIRACGSSTLFACYTPSGCRYKSSDGQSWSCDATEATNSYDDPTCQNASCLTAAQEAADWCTYESPGRSSASGRGETTGSGGSDGSGG